jgi:glutamate N-acetyltransferase/amino-acid N-acetyltransferase
MPAKGSAMVTITQRSPLAPEGLPSIPPVPGVRWAVHAAGLRYQGRPDLLLIELADYTAAAGVFTRSAVPGHPVTWCRKILPKGTARAVLVNAGNANVFRGGEGDAACLASARAVAAALNCPQDEVYLASTGIIGARLPVEKIVEAVPALTVRLREDGIAGAAEAIMTTDTFPKAGHRIASIDGVPVTLAGIAKGSGMIAPDMATMLAFVVTDAHIIPEVLQALLEEGTERSFNAITVDGDTSTSDTLLLLATQKADHPPVVDPEDPRLGEFREALFEVLEELALLVVRDGEGARKLITVTVEGALGDEAARRIGLSVANSPLVKTAIAGGDANWGRVIMAVGKAGEEIELERLGVAFGGHVVARDGGAVPDLDEAPVTEHLRGSEVEIRISVGEGPGVATVWTCDLTHGYIDINADYRS